ncbi:MAG: hypothetical protein KDF65_11150, partial [Anaerolineae bacterium]|nr:hypothetical protein [Anaerolineae bacterium]
MSAIIEGGNIWLYDATAQAYEELQANGNPANIRAVVVLSDGEDTSSGRALEQVLALMSGNDADLRLLQRLAETTGGRMFDGDPENINAVYAEIALFF